MPTNIIKRHRHRFVTFITLAVCLVSASIADLISIHSRTFAAEAKRPPNIVLIFADDKYKPDSQSA